MKKTFLAAISVLAILLPAFPVRAGWGDPILHWNAIAIQAVADDHSGRFGPPEHMGPGRCSRALAMVHVAMFDAVNSIHRRSEPYHSYVPGATADASIDAAVAVAAHTVLIEVYSNQR